MASSNKKMPNTPYTSLSGILQYFVLTLFLLILLSCTPETPITDGKIGGGQGDTLVLECSAEQPCPEGYECIAVQETKGNCRRQI